MLNIPTPLTYQGGKQRIADQILDIINPDPSDPFNDLCCGSGAMSIALVNRGFPVNKIRMIDQGPWGLFWQAIGNGSFDLKEFKRHVDNVPKKIELIQPYIKELSKQPADQDTIYVYLLLQASSFGGKALWIKDNRWQNSSFRNYWLPTATSNRKSPVNPMMPMPGSLYKRISEIAEKMVGLEGQCRDLTDVNDFSGTIYIDPPYMNTTFYGHKLNVVEFAKTIKSKCYVSEGVSLSDQSWQITSTRLKGGISGLRKSLNEEWLSLLN